MKNGQLCAHTCMHAGYIWRSLYCMFEIEKKQQETALSSQKAELETATS